MHSHIRNVHTSSMQVCLAKKNHDNCTQSFVQFLPGTVSIKIAACLDSWTKIGHTFSYIYQEHSHCTRTVLFKSHLSFLEGIVFASVHYPFRQNDNILAYRPVVSNLCIFSCWETTTLIMQWPLRSYSIATAGEPQAGDYICYHASQQNPIYIDNEAAGVTVK